MFVQVFKGQVSDAGEMRAALERWQQDLAPGATGWLGSTSGVTENGTFVGIARFESEDAARRNSDRPEQGQWWSQTEKLFTGEVTFRDSTDVILDLQGDPDTAGFVQVMQGRNSDPARAWELMSQDPDKWAAFRPDVLGSVAANHGGGDYTMVLYFTSEQDAREGERKEAPAELKALMEEMDALSEGVPDFFDLKDPWLQKP